jgi:phosphonate transport system substrate-binding protein
MQRKNLLSAIALLTALFLASVGHAANYNFGVMPWQKGQTADDIRARYKPMLEWLGKETGDTFTIVGTRDYEQMVDFLANGRIQVANISPLPYVLAKRKNPEIRLLVTELSWNKERTKKIDSYRGYILALKSRTDLNKLEDLKDRQFGFVDEESTSGFQYPSVLLRERGIEYKSYFSKYYFLGGHPRVTDAIVSGSIDAGATWDYNWSQADKKHGDVFKPLFETPPIPNLCIAAHPSLPLNVQKKIVQALPRIDENLLKGLPAAGYVVRPDSFYDVVRKLVQ